MNTILLLPSLLPGTVFLLGSAVQSKPEAKIEHRKANPSPQVRTVVYTPANDLEESLHFYQRLDFEVLSDDPVLVTDGKVIVEIDPDPFARPGIKLYRDSWSDEVRILKESTAVTDLDDGYLLSGPSGVWVYLTEGDLEIADRKMERAAGALGNFSGLSLETIDLEGSAKFWQALGFRVSSGSTEAAWLSLEGEDRMTLSLMRPLSCPHLFFNPSMTYFNGDRNPAIIQTIREAGIPIVEEITRFNERNEVDNVVLRDPGGYGIFVFND